MAAGCPSFSNKNYLKIYFEKFMKWMKRDSYLPRDGVNTRSIDTDQKPDGPPNTHYHPHPAEHYIDIALDAVQRAKYSKNYHNDLLLDHLNIAGDALDTALETLRYMKQQPGNFPEPRPWRKQRQIWK